MTRGSKVEGHIADLIRTRTGLSGDVTIDEYIGSGSPGCETCGYGGEPDHDIDIWVGRERVLSLMGENATFFVVSEWLNGSNND